MFNFLKAQTTDYYLLLFYIKKVKTLYILMPQSHSLNFLNKITQIWTVLQILGT